jgi:hypothetical protein
MKGLGVVTPLDLRLLLARRPVLALLPGLLAVAAIWLLARPAQSPEPVTDTAGDTARIVAAQRNFRAVLIAPGALAASQQELLEAASRHHLTVGQVDYVQEANAAGRFSQAGMNLPLSGRYVDIRAFLDSALANQPALSFRHLAIQRNASADSNLPLTATLTVQFLVGEPSQ